MNGSRLVVREVGSVRLQGQVWSHISLVLIYFAHLPTNATVLSPKYYENIIDELTQNVLPHKIPGEFEALPITGQINSENNRKHGSWQSLQKS